MERTASIHRSLGKVVLCTRRHVDVQSRSPLALRAASRVMRRKSPCTAISTLARSSSASSLRRENSSYSSASFSMKSSPSSSTRPSLCIGLGLGSSLGLRSRREWRPCTVPARRRMCRPGTALSVGRRCPRRSRPSRLDRDARCWRGIRSAQAGSRGVRGRSAGKMCRASRNKTVSSRSVPRFPLSRNHRVTGRVTV